MKFDRPQSRSSIRCEHFINFEESHEMSVSVPQVLDTPFIGFHAGFRASETLFGEDQVIYGEDEPAQYIYEVIRGAVRSYKTLSDGRRQICAFHLPGDIFGLETGPSYRFTAEAVVATSIHIVRRHRLESVASHDIRVANKLLKLTADTLLQAKNQMLLLGRKSPIERVAAFLLEMEHRLPGTGMVALPMCRRDIADYLGLTPETVSRALSHLRDKRIIGFSEFSHREIVLQDRHWLQKCADARRNAES